MMWFRRIHSPQERFQCGIQFLPGRSDLDFQQWFDGKITQLSQTEDAKILNNMVSGTLSD